MSVTFRLFALLLVTTTLVCGCQSGPETPATGTAPTAPAVAPPPPPPPLPAPAPPPAPAPAPAELAPPPGKAAAQPPPHPAEKTPPGALAPRPPLRETFDGQPQLSLFPRAAAFRPEDDNSQGLSLWNTVIDHVLRSSGVAAGVGRDATQGWVVRNIKGLDSVAFFAPIAVKPDTTYRIAIDLMTALPKGVSAGVGVLEFDRFLWIGEQYPASLCKSYQTNARLGVKISGDQPWKTHSFTFRTSPAAGMLHLVLFCDGLNDLQGAAIFDNLVIEEAPLKGGKGG